MKITSVRRLLNDEFFVTTSTFLADLTYKSDTVHFVSENVMRSVPGFRVGLPITVNLSTEKVATIRALAVGELVTF